MNNELCYVDNPVFIIPYMIIFSSLFLMQFFNKIKELKNYYTYKQSLLPLLFFY